MPETATRPLPSPSELTQPFWDAAARGVLVRPVCDRCGASFFTPQVCCPSCLSEQWSWVQSAGRGAVYSATVCHRAPEPGFDVPYVLAIVDLDEGWDMLSNVVGCAPAEVAIGMRVRVAWESLGDGIVLPVFEPDA
jgi:uncharacterized OB-fold protein